jgi:hypothetical protein
MTRMLRPLYFLARTQADDIGEARPPLLHRQIQPCHRAALCRFLSPQCGKRVVLAPSAINHSNFGGTLALFVRMPTPQGNDIEEICEGPEVNSAAPD